MQLFLQAFVQYNISSMNKIMLKFELCLQTKLYQEEFKNINKDNR